MLHAKQQAAKRGRTKWQPQWTRVISVDDDELNDIAIFPLHLDVQLQERMRRPEAELVDAAWVPLFLPSAYGEEIKELSLEERQMDVDELQRLGAMVSRHRAHL